MKKKTLLPLLILGQSFVFNGQVYAQVKSAEDIKSQTGKSDVQDPDLKAANNSWIAGMQSLVKDQLINASLKFSNRLIGVTSASGSNVGLNYGYGSEPSISGNYSAMDTWSIGGGYIPSAFGNSNLSPGISIAREITFVEQFKTRRESMKRHFYNPIERIPLTSAKAMQMKEKDFVAFRSPMILSLGKGFSELSSAHAERFSGISLYSMGQVDVHIYRMPENHVRVRLFALKEKGLNMNVGVQLVGFKFSNYASSMLNIQPINAFSSQTNSDLFSVDYVFNLDKPEAREEYDKLVSQKLRVTDLKNIGEQIKAANPFKSAGEIKELFYADLESVQRIVEENAHKSLKERSIIRLTKSETEEAASTYGLSGRLTKLLNFTMLRRDSQKSVSLTNIENENRKFQLNTVSKEFNFELFTLFGAENKSESGLLTSTNDKFAPQDVLGFQSRRFKKDLNFEEAEFKAIKSRFEANAPASVYKQIKWPKWDFSAGAIKNVSIEHIVFFNVPALQSIDSITKESIKTELKNVIRTWGRLGSEPVYTSQSDETIDSKFRLEKFHQGKYVEAYSWELDLIPDRLINIFSSNITTAEKMKYFSELQNIPLFNEIGPALVVRLIPEDKLADAINYRLEFTGMDFKGNTGALTNFPSDTSKQGYINIVANAIAQTEHTVDRTYNLRLFINEKGESYSLQDLANQSK